MTDLFRHLPAVTTVLEQPDVQNLTRLVSRAQLTDCVRTALNQVRSQLSEEKVDATVESLLRTVVDEALRQVSHLRLRRLNQVINATGIVLHTNLGRAALSDSAVERLTLAARATNVELDLVTGKRARRGAGVEDLLTQPTGAPAALVVNNCAAATMLALQGVAGGKEVIIARGQLVEIGGGFRLPEVFEAAGVILKEVGTANRTRIEDYENAINDQTGALLRVHRSNFRVSGFVSEPSAAELVRLARKHQLPMIDDLGSGCVASLSSLGLDEPDVATSLNSNAELVLFSGDKLLGGPQAGILLGQSAWIERLRRQPMARAIRVGKLTLAALEATLEEHLAGEAFQNVPVMAMLATSADSIKARCEAVARAVKDCELDVTVTTCQSEVGGGSLADQTIDSFAIRLQGQRPDDLLRALRTGEDRVLARIENDAVLLDLRSVRPEDDCIIERSIRLAGQHD